MTGDILDPVCKKVSGYKKRECFKTLEKYLRSDIFGRVCVLSGLRRTGKTTLIFQAIAGLPKDKTVYIKIMRNDTMDNLNSSRATQREFGEAEFSKTCAGFSTSFVVASLVGLC